MLVTHRPHLFQVYYNSAGSKGVIKRVQVKENTKTGVFSGKTPLGSAVPNEVTFFIAGRTDPGDAKREKKHNPGIVMPQNYNDAKLIQFREARRTAS